MSTKPEKQQPNLWVAAFDIHHPEVHRPTLRAMLDFLSRNRSKVAGFIFGGDQFNNAEISHHNANKPIYKPVGSYKRNTQSFDTNVLTPIEKRLPANAEKVWIEGNHDDWSRQFIESHPELQGMMEQHKLLRIEERGWKFVPCGQAFKLGKLNVIHGETLTGIGNQAPQAHARKAVEVYAGNILFGHMHSPQTFTKILPHNKTDKWQGTCAPILGAVNPVYLRNKPTAWLNGFVVIEMLDGGNFNLYSIVVSNGRFSFGGVIYGDS